MSRPAPLRVLLVDDAPMLRRSLHAYLTERDDVQVVGQADTSRGTIEQLTELAAADQLPDVALVDLAMPGTDGLTTTADIRRHHPTVTVVVLTSLATDQLVPRALHAGATGYLRKDVLPEAVVAALHTAAGQRPTTSPPASPPPHSPGPPPPGTDLGPQPGLHGS